MKKIQYVFKSYDKGYNKGIIDLSKILLHIFSVKTIRHSGEYIQMIIKQEIDNLQADMETEK